MQTEVYSTIRSISGNTAEDVAMVTQKLNEGVVDVLLNTHCYVLPADMDAIAHDNGDYTMDPAILHIESVSIEGSTQTLRQVRAQDILDMRLSGALPSAPARYYAVQGSDLFMLYPSPDGTETITVYYVPFPTAALVDASDDPSASLLGGIPTEFHRAIVLYALSHMADQDDDQSSGQGVRYQQDYERWLVRIRKHVSQKGGTGLAPFKLRRRRQFAFHDPSTDGGW